MTPTVDDPAGTGPADLALVEAWLDRVRSPRAATETSFVPVPTGEPLPHLPAPVCAPAATAEELTAFFDGGTPMIGADDQRAYPLPGGRVLWLFQDAFLPTSHGPQLVHTAQYWDGAGWVDEPARAVPVIPRDGRSVNPSQIVVLDDRFVAVTKVGDWCGRTIHLDVADAAEGPWTTYTTVTVTPSCDRCNSYFASVVPFGHDATSFVIGLSTNTWEGHDLARLEPVFLTVPAP